MVVRCLHLKLDNGDGVYYCSATLTGTLHFTCTGPTPSHGVIVQLVGECKTRVRHFHTSTEQPHNHTKLERDTMFDVHKATEEYINTTRVLLQPSGHTIQPGIYSLPFSFDLPRGIPCSFSGSYGKVRYFIRYRTNHRSGDQFVTFSKDEQAVGIVVLSSDNPNEFHHVWDRVKFSGSKTFGVFAQSSPLSADIRLPKRVFVPGEIIPISAKIVNRSNHPIRKCEIWIKQITHYSAPGTLQTEETAKHFAKMTRPGFGADTWEFWNNLPFFVPPLPPTELPHCNYITVEHRLMVKFIPVRGSALSLEEMITITTIPVLPQCAPDIDFMSAIITPPPNLDTGDITTSLPIDSSFRPVRFSEEAHGNKRRSLTVDKLFDGISKLTSSYGTESCRPKYPVFDLKQDCAENDFEVI